MLKPIFLELIGKRCSSLAQSEQAYCGASLAIGAHSTLLPESKRMDDEDNVRTESIAYVLLRSCS